MSIRNDFNPFNTTIVNAFKSDLVLEGEENINFHTTAEVKLKNCNFGSVNAGKKATAHNCQDFEEIVAKEIEIKNSTVKDVYAGEQVDINESTITNLKFSLDSMIANSIVESILVNPNGGRREPPVDNGRVFSFPIPYNPNGLEKTNINLVNTIVTNDIKFIGERGKVFLSGDSEVRGKVINGEVERLHT